MSDPDGASPIGASVLVACFPGCGWNGEVALDSARIWRCPNCDVPRRFRSHRATPIGGPDR